MLLRVSAIALALFAFTGCQSASTEARADIKAEKDRHTAPDFSLRDANGQSVKLSDFRGKVVLLDFWATWCGPCKIEIPWFIEFEQQYRDKGLVVLGVSMDEDGWESVKPYIAARKINYRVVVGDEHVGQQYGGIESLPTTFLIDKSGKIAAVHVGLSGKESFQNDIRKLLDSPRAGLVNGSHVPALVTAGR